MSVQFILGRSGTGKTRFCLDNIIGELVGGDGSRPMILLVPEQATYQAERAILNDGRVGGYSNLRVLSFERLEFHLIGGAAGNAEISRIGQELAVGRILNQCRDELEVFGGSAGTAGLASKLAKTIVELHQCALSAEEVERIGREMRDEPGNETAGRKFADIAKVFRKYVEFMEGRFVNPDVRLSEAVEHVADAEFVRGARLWVDGFASFTVQQREMLVELLRHAEGASIAMCLDPGAIDLELREEQVDETSIFHVTERTYAELREVLRRNKIAVDEPLVLSDVRRFSHAQELGQLEANLFEAGRAETVTANGRVRVLAAGNARAEVEWIAREIVRLVREEGYRYRDIAVVASDLGRYRHYVQAVFEDHGIAFFMDTPRSVQQHPLAEFLTAGLSCVTRGFASSDVFAYLKSDLAGLSRREVDELENYCVAFGVEGDDWLRGGWSYAGAKDKRFDEERVESLRRRAVGPLARLAKKLNGEDGITAGEFTQAVFDWIGEVDAAGRIQEWIGDGGEDETGSEHGQIFDKLVDLFDELCEIYGGDELAGEEWAQVLCEAMGKLTLKLIPQRLDEVLVGSIDRSRHPELRAVFLAGVTQKQFPVVVSYDSILTDDDRAAAEERDVVLGGQVSEQLTARQYLAYIAFTRASERLYVTYPLTQDEGKECVPSSFVRNIERLYSDVEVERIGGAADGLQGVVSYAGLADFLCQRLSRDVREESEERRTLRGLVDAMCVSDDERMREVGELVKDALEYANEAELADGIAGEIFGDELRSSASRLRTFASCPYKYFAQYTLGLAERAEAGFEPVDLGSFYHEVLEGVSKELIGKGRSFCDAEDELAVMVEKQAEEIIEANGSLCNFAGRSAYNKFMIGSAVEVLKDCVADLRRMDKAGAFRLTAVEKEFGKDDVPCEVGLADGRRCRLRGKIDRVDVAEIEGRKYALLFDYKRKEQKVEWDKLYYGLDVQLAAYMIAAKQFMAGEVDDVAGAFYVPIEAGAVKGSLEKREEAGEKFARKSKGIVNGEFCEGLDAGAEKWDPYYNFYAGKKGPYGHYKNSCAVRPSEMERVLGHTEGKIAEIAERIFGGEIAIRPIRLSSFVPCEWCSFKPVCRFDGQVNEYEVLGKMNKEDFMNETGADDE
ncbi:ATP-dependent helicase/deoxyribonuclease subunit B [Anaerohalosphaera lusitana]|uniref:ATP-dependent helicase/deoxyribonuclease subunit B n=1 Tax=Anaerohalosphaera lusitana TaxID=1936003 RepID=A0A1U9NI39_9BACT|nr:PD-(D/E)XK nuclease family protein [Anaerohalosphaera lusitana]AQT67270.1 ATP-dependent helicase/deoxyribonuclease subunit B [Anaerohalosphaera lusitana]